MQVKERILYEEKNSFKYYVKSFETPYNFPSAFVNVMFITTANVMKNTLRLKEYW